MARLDVNRSGELEVFVRSVELGGFSAAARALGMTPSAVSKLVARLEARLGARARENAEQVAERLARRAPFVTPAGVHLTTIDNSGVLDAAGRAFVDVVRGAVAFGL